MTKEILFSVTAADCDWICQRGSGNGGQKKNKTSSAVRCLHRASGAAGYAEDNRSQHINRQTAFKRMAATEAFKTWHKIEVMRQLGQDAVIEDNVNTQMRFIKIEGVVDGKWEELK